MNDEGQIMNSQRSLCLLTSQSSMTVRRGFRRLTPRAERQPTLQIYCLSTIPLHHTQGTVEREKSMTGGRIQQNEMRMFLRSSHTTPGSPCPPGSDRSNDGNP
jgi:hypothetical protein